MTDRRTLTRRNDRPGEPHSRIPDAVYFELLPFLTGNEVKLWLALKSRVFRKATGERRGLVRRSLNRIAQDIRMPRATAQRAFSKLRSKHLAEWTGLGIRVLEPAFTTAVITDVTTQPGPLWATPRPTMGRTRPTMGQEGQLVPFSRNRLDHGRSDLTNRSASGASSPTVEPSTVPTKRASPGSARASARRSRALPPAKEKPEVQNNQEGENNEERRPLSREEAKRVLQQVHEIADAAELARRTPKQERERRERERVELLRRQAAELQGEPGEPKEET